jgi:circadian clock protein KaiC
LISGAAGSGKTVMALQFLYLGARDYEENGALVTFEETPSDLVQNVRSFGWDLDGLIKEQRIAVVDATSTPEEEWMHTGLYDLSALLARVEHAVESVGAKRIILDAINTLFAQLPDPELVSRDLLRLATRLRRLRVTTLVTTRRRKDGGRLDDFTPDNVVLLRNRLGRGERLRTVEILKVRGAAHRSGEHRFTIDPNHGFMVLDAAPES